MFALSYGFDNPSFISFFFLSFLASLQRREFLGQGSDPSYSCDLSHTCGNTGSLTHCARLGIKPLSWHSQDAANPVAPQWELLLLFLLSLLSYFEALLLGGYTFRIIMSSWSFDSSIMKFSSLSLVLLLVSKSTLTLIYSSLLLILFIWHIFFPSFYC